MEEFVVFETEQAPDRALADLEARLKREGFSTQASERFDIEARRWLDRVFVGVGSHPDGLAARVKAKSLIPGRADELALMARRSLADTLGEGRLESREASR